MLREGGVENSGRELQGSRGAVPGSEMTDGLLMHTHFHATSLQGPDFQK